MTSKSELEDMTNHFVSEIKLLWFKFLPDSQFVEIGCSAMRLNLRNTDVREVSKALQKQQTEKNSGNDGISFESLMCHCSIFEKTF